MISQKPVTTQRLKTTMVEKSKQVLFTLIEAAGTSILAGIVMAAVYVGMYTQHIGEMERRLKQLESVRGYTQVDADLNNEKVESRLRMMERDIKETASDVREVKELLDRRLPHSK